LEILSWSEKDQLLNHFNRTSTDFPEEKTITRIFEDQVEGKLDHIAQVGQIPNPKFQIPNKISITYNELNQNSNQLAWFLIEKGVKLDTTVAILVEQCVEMIIGLLGILKAGAAYLPIDIDYPKERKRFILADSGANILVTTRNLFADRKMGKSE
jgi:non-ribosomal peptide synthetase component F